MAVDLAACIASLPEELSLAPMDAWALRDVLAQREPEQYLRPLSADEWGGPG